MRYKYNTLLAVLAALLIACGEGDTISSDLVNTASIHANIHVTASDNQKVFVDVELLPNGPSSRDRIVLSNSDELWASNANEFNLTYEGDDVFASLKNISDSSMKLNAETDYKFNFLLFKFSQNISGAWHTAELAPNVNDIYHIALLRDEFTDADKNTVSLPTAFDLTAPLIDETLSRSNDLVINWQASSSDQVSINIVSSCFNDIYDEQEINNLDDSTGSYTVLAADFSPNASGQCTTVIEVVKSRLGQLDSNFRSGIISGHRVEKVSVITTD